MPIIFVHGVKTRDHELFESVSVYLRNIVAPALSSTSDAVSIQEAYWGDLGATFGWDGASRPRTRLLGMGPSDESVRPFDSTANAAMVAVLGKFIPSPAAPADDDGYLSGQDDEPPEPSSNDPLPAARLIALVSDLIDDQWPPDQAGRAAMLKALARATSNAALLEALDALPTFQAQFDRLLTELERVETDEFAAMGLDDLWGTLKNGSLALLDAAHGAASNAFMAIAEEVRPPLTDLLAEFIGDVCCYLADRGAAERPGQIPLRLLDQLRIADAEKRRTGEPIIVVTHSMGGQIVYDVVTHFLPNIDEFRAVKIDFWCATASQVGFFQEAQLFIEKPEGYGPGRPIPFPRQNLHAWWNVWDYNDFISFTSKGIIADVDDERFDTGLSLFAHSGYLRRPSLYQRMVHKLDVLGLTKEGRA